MYEAFYQLNANPFRLTPDPKFCFSHAGYKSAREYLDYALRLGEGFIMVTGRPGTGKTTLAETFLKDLDPTRVLAERVAVSGLEADDLLRAVAFAYGIEANGLDKATLRHRIQQYFILQKQRGQRALLIIDEAQGLPPPSLEELRLLADLQAGSQPLLQLFLVGQEALRELMCTPGMDQFQQRIIATCHLKPLDLRETRAYLKHRLCQAGWKGDPELTGAALLAIHQCTRGVPRHINKLCNRLLVLGYGKGKHILDEEEVQSISGELRDEQLTPLGSARQTSDESNATRSREEPLDDAYSLSELALDRNSVEAEKPHPSLAPASMVRSETHAATRQSQQTAQRRVQARAKARRESQPVKSSTPRGNGVSTLGKVRQRYEPSLTRLFTRRDRLKVGMAWGAAALVVVTLSTAMLARFSEEDRTDMAIMPDEHRAPINPSRLAHGEDRANTDIGILHTGEHEPPPQTLAAIPDSTPEIPPGNRNRIDGSWNAAVIEAAIRVPTPEKIPITSTPVVKHAPVDATTPLDQVSETKQDGPEINGLETVADKEAMAASNRVLPDIESMDAPAAGAGTGKMVPAEDHPVAPPVSREEKIDALLAKGQQSLRKFRLLTPAGDNANHYFKEVLALDPGNTDARQGFNRIAERYVILARRANARHDSKLARLYISQGLQVRPSNRDLLALQDSMNKPPARDLSTIAKTSPAVEPPPKETGFFSRLKSLFTKKQDHSVDVKVKRQETNRASGRWAINLVTLQRKVDAEHFAQKANSKGVEAEINQVTVRGKKYSRVQVPGFSSPAEARTKANEVQNMLGLKDVWIVQR
jgi:type II secretory pathway predicted ATPase ExeA